MESLQLTQTTQRAMNNVYLSSIIKGIFQNLPPSAPLPFLHFKELREMNTVHLQCELAKYDRGVNKDKMASRDLLQLEDLLHRYSEFGFKPSISELMVSREILATSTPRPRLLAAFSGRWCGPGRPPEVCLA